jgi:hypothetical protein
LHRLLTCLLGSLPLFLLFLESFLLLLNLLRSLLLLLFLLFLLIFLLNLGRHLTLTLRSFFLTFLLIKNSLPLIVIFLLGLSLLRTTFRHVEVFLL